MINVTQNKYIMVDVRAILEMGYRLLFSTIIVQLTRKLEGGNIGLYHAQTQVT